MEKMHLSVVKPRQIQQREGFRDNNRRSRRSFFARLIIGTTTIAVSIGAYFSYLSVRSLILENLTEKALLQVRKGANEIDAWLSEKTAEIEAIAASPLLDDLDRAIAEPYLQREVQRLEEDFTALSMVSAEGFMYASSRDTPRSLNFSDRAWFKQVMSTGKSTISDPLLGRITQAPLIVVSAPILARVAVSSTPIGAITGSISMDRVTKVVESLQYGKNSYAFALNSRGEPIVHPDRDLMANVDQPAVNFQEAEDPELRRITAQMLANETRIELISLKGRWVYIVYFPLKEADWSIALVIPRGNIESRSRHYGISSCCFSHLYDYRSLASAGLRAKTTEKVQRNRRSRQPS